MNKGLNFEKFPKVKCIHCGKVAGDHNHFTRACPQGARHRTLGFSSYSSKTVFAPKPLRMSEAQLQAANVSTLKAFLYSHDLATLADHNNGPIRLLRLALKTRKAYMERPVGGAYVDVL